MRLSAVNSSGKKPSRGKKFAAQNLGCHLDAWIICIINKRKIGESRRSVYILGFRLCLYLFSNYILCVGCYSPDIYSFRFSSALNPDSSIRMNSRDSPWFFTVSGLCFAEDAFLYNEYFITNFVIIVDMLAIFAFGVTIRL